VTPTIKSKKVFPRRHGRLPADEASLSFYHENGMSEQC
jgi:hypothetical protein